MPLHGWVNLHFSLLPAWRGAAPVQHAIMAGDEVTGASTFRLEAGLDTGPVFGTVTEAIGPRDTAGDLLGRLAVSGAGLLVATLDGIARRHAGRRAAARRGHQPRARRSRPPTRGSTGRCPRTWSTGGSAASRRRPAPGRRGAASGCASDRWSRCPPSTLEPGEVAVGGDGVLVGAGRGAVRLGQVQPAGKRMLPAADWARGARPAAGERMGA